MQVQSDWDRCQARANELLAEGVWLLQSQPARRHLDAMPQCAGNYLISLNGVPQYIGEANDVRARIHQQYTVKLSTFHKNHCRCNPAVEIDRFLVQARSTFFGRKEVEEFGITNIPCPLNKFQLGKRPKCVAASACDHWKVIQSDASRIIGDGCDRVMAASLVRGDVAKPPALPGIYVLLEKAGMNPLYIGESSDLAERWHKAHCRSTYFSALRRHVATDLLGFSLKVRNGKAKYLEEAEEVSVTRFLHSAQFAFMPISLGRFEIEECLIGKYAPRLNRKGNKSSP